MAIDINKLDMRLSPVIDSYLLNFESMKMIDTLFKEYNELDSVKQQCVKDLKDSRFFDKYNKVYNFLSVLTLNREYDDDELMFISNICYKLKGSVESIKLILNLVQCSYDDIEIDDDLTLKMKITFENVREIYLSSKYLQLLCQDLLYFSKYDVTIDSMSVRYNLMGDVNKRYAVYTTYDLSSTIVDKTSENTVSEPITEPITDESQIHDSEEIEESSSGLKKITRKHVVINEDDRTVTTTTTISQEKYRKIDTLTIDTYEW